jgi:YesN/AraC family two-component response regulator
VLSITGDRSDARSRIDTTFLSNARRCEVSNASPIRELIDASYAQPVTLRMLSTALDRQASYLGALFRRETGVSVRHWLTSVRLDRASALIREGVKIDAVGMLVGYRSKKNSTGSSSAALR